MSSFRAVAALRPRVSALIRNPVGTKCQCLASSLQEKLVSPITTSAFSSKGSQIRTESADNTSLQERTSTNSDSLSDGVPSAKDPASDKIDEEFSELVDSLIEGTASTQFTKGAEWRLKEWNRQMKEYQNAGKPVDLKNITSRHLPTVADYVLTPTAPPELRYKCLSLVLSQKTDNSVTEKLLTKTVADAMLLPIKVVADIVHNLSTAPETELRRKTRLDLVTTVVNKRWYEIMPRHVVFFMYQLDDLFSVRKISQQMRQLNRPVKEGGKRSKGETKTNSAKGIQDSPKPEDADKNKSSQLSSAEVKSLPVMSVNIETRVTGLADELKVKDLARVVTLLAKWRSRNQTLLNALIHRLCQAELGDFSFLQLNNLLFSCSVLSIHNEDFLRKLTFHLRQLTPSSPSLACAVLTSLSHLRWKDPDLISVYVGYLSDRVSELPITKVRDVLTSLANLYTLPTTDQMIKLITELTSKALSADVSLEEQVNCLWCLAILKSLDAKTTRTVLDVGTSQQDFSSPQKQVMLQKLRGIHLTAQYEIQDYSGPFLPDLLINPSKVAMTSEEEKLNAALVKTLAKYADLKTYAKLSQTLSGGIRVDAVMCANDEGDVRPLDVSEGESSSKRNIHRLALQVLPFTAVIGSDQTPVGAHQMTARHLRHMGYVPVQILYYDLRPSLSVLEQIHNIKARIKSAVSTADPAR